MACYRLFQAEGRSAGVPGTAYGGSLASPGPPELAPDFFRGFFHEINHPLLVEHGKKTFYGYRRNLEIFSGNLHTFIYFICIILK